MSGLNPLRIALSGFGGAVLTIALSGFVVESDAPVPPIAPIAAVSEGGGHRRQATQPQTRAELERRLRGDDDAIVLAIVAFVLGDSG